MALVPLRASRRLSCWVACLGASSFALAGACSPPASPAVPVGPEVVAGAASSQPEPSAPAVASGAVSSPAAPAASLATTPSAAPASPQTAAEPPPDPPCQTAEARGRKAETQPVDRAFFGFRPDPRETSGHLAVEPIHRIIRGRSSCYRRCYAEGLGRSPMREGRVVVELHIDGSSGKVKQAADRGSTLRDAAVVACVVDEMRLLRFPPPGRNDVTVTYPLSFIAPSVQ